METQPPKNLEELIHRELLKLPERAAPETLIPRVLAQIQARANRRWWQCSWSHWPFPLKVLSLPFLLAGLAAAVAGASALWNWGSAEPGLEFVSAKLESITAFWNLVSALGNSVLVLGRAAGGQWLLVALLVPLIMYLACIALGTLCYRMAVSHQ
jgi:hypothetical protein